jgi:hypothetical protein
MKYSEGDVVKIYAAVHQIDGDGIQLSIHGETLEWWFSEEAISRLEIEADPESYKAREKTYLKKQLEIIQKRLEELDEED